MAWLLTLNRIEGVLCILHRSALSWFLALASSWGAWVLIHPPSNFERFHDSFALVSAMSTNEFGWAAFIAFAAILQWYYTICVWFGVRNALRFLSAMFALPCHAFFWLVMGGSTVLGNHDTLFGVPMMLVGGLALLNFICMGLRGDG